tara:strand:- start:206 stop:871 length:666 start_codon:yes stop_codon:yes gene_type:complete
MNNEFQKRILSSLILIPLSFFFIIKGSIFFNLFLIICFLVTSYEWHKMTKKKNYHLIGHLFLIFSFYSAYLLRNLGNLDGLVFLFVIIVCVSTDIGGYIFGKILKGPKLTKISPNKTYSGMIGGYLLSIILIYLFINYSFYFSKSFNLSSEDFNFEALIIVFLISSMSQLGDIIISNFKRLSKIKDTGKIIPGHGGLLDRIDGMIFAFPLSYIIISLGILK